jgi:hypothetical protein
MSTAPRRRVEVLLPSSRVAPSAWFSHTTGVACNSAHFRQNGAAGSAARRFGEMGVKHCAHKRFMDGSPHSIRFRSVDGKIPGRIFFANSMRIYLPRRVTHVDVLHDEVIAADIVLLLEVLLALLFSSSADGL